MICLKQRIIHEMKHYYPNFQERSPATLHTQHRAHISSVSSETFLPFHHVNLSSLRVTFPFSGHKTMAGIQCGCDLVCYLVPELNLLAFVCIDDTVLQDKHPLNSTLHLKVRNTDALIADEGTQSKPLLLMQRTTLWCVFPITLN